MAKEIQKNYDPKIVEDKWYENWVENGYFKANPNSEKKPFTIVIPPPNVTSVLHMGHAYNNTIQDILIRWKRMQGFEALYQPGSDHAGIATQTVVEKQLKKEGSGRKEIGREKFVERVWEWREQYGSAIVNQLKKLGVSADWSRERFTLDEGLSKAVQTVFIDLYEKGLVYKGNRIVNWDPGSVSALADDEVDHVEVNGKLYHIKYKFADSDETLTVATTRPETLLGDTAVAIAPDDEEKKKYIGKKVIIPFVNREVPIIVDEHVDKSFGSGFVKVTPAHDPNDFEMGQRHNLDQILVLDKEANVLSTCQIVVGADSSDELPIPEKFAGLDRYEARKLIISTLDEMGQLGEIKDHMHAVGHSYRSKVAIEPYLSEQWFVNMKPLAEKALAAVQNGDVKLYPEGRYDKVYENWMTNIRDWCISRQLWWGHRIPAWYNDAGEIKVCADDPSTPDEKWTQDPDVLDTWFSSWLWPFSTMGWPEKTDDLDYFYPSDVLVTGADIIFFWVARMIMAGYEFLGKRPFHTVYFNGIVRDQQGRKMSKSLGNGIDPIDMIEKYSTDAVRYTVVQLSSQGQDIKLSEKDFETGRNFSNKIWNSFRFLSMNLDDFNLDYKNYTDRYELADKWILSRLQNTIESMNDNLEKYRFSDSLHAIYTFYWNDFCDWYLELIKNRLYNADNPEDKYTALAIASHVMKQSMVLLHSFMPFITEEIWQYFRTNDDDASIMLTNWITSDTSLKNDEAENQLDLIKNLIVKIRNVRAEMNIPPKNEATMNVLKTSSGKEDIIRENAGYFKSSCKVVDISIVGSFEDVVSATIIEKDLELQLPLAGMIDLDAEKTRLQNEIDKKEKLLKGTSAKLANENFVKGAPDHIVAHERQKLSDVAAEIEKLKANIESLG